MSRLRLLSAVVTVAAALAACGEPAPPAKAPAASAAPVPRPPTPSDSACPRDGSWRRCHLDDRLNKAGFGFKVDSVPITVPYLPVPGTRYKVGRVASMAVFYFADSAAGAKATAGLDPLSLTPRGDTIGAWPARPTEVIRSVNLIAVLFDASPTQAERVRLAITAGAPQPPSPTP